MNKRTLSAVTVGSFIIALAVGLIVYVATKEVQMILWVTMLIFGIALIALSFLYSSESKKFGPSESIYILVCGVIVTVIGVIGILHTYTDISIWILVAIFLIVLALTGIAVALINGNKEGK